MRPASIERIEAQELFKWLRWYGRLRWLAAAGLVAASVCAPYFGFPQLWPGLLIVGVVVAAYNLYFRSVLRPTMEETRSLACRRWQAVAEIALDLGALLFVVHLTGGLLSPMLMFFVFHMAIGTMLLPARTMYSIAAVTCLAVFALHVGESSGALPYRPIDPAISEKNLTRDLNMVTLMMTLVGTVYLTGRVAKESKERNRQLLQVTTELQSKTEELQKTLSDIQELERRKSHYMRISAHQLRSPLATVKTTLQVLTQGFMDPASDRGQKLLDGTVQRVDDLLAMVNDLLELAKIREGWANAPWRQDVDVRQILLHVVEALQASAKKHQIRLVSEAERAPILSWGVPPDLRFALENIIHNAIRYSNPGGEVRVILDDSDDEATIAVVDRGIGIPEELQRDVFLEFVRAPNAKRHAPQGTGLGLAIVKETVDMHGGTSSLESELGVGTTVTVQLRLRNAPPPGAVIDGAREQPESEAGSSRVSPVPEMPRSELARNDDADRMQEVVQDRRGEA